MIKFSQTAQCTTIHTRRVIFQRTTWGINAQHTKQYPSIPSPLIMCPFEQSGYPSKRHIIIIVSIESTHLNHELPPRKMSRID